MRVGSGVDYTQVCVLWRHLLTRGLALTVLYQAEADHVFHRRAALTRFSKYGTHAAPKVVQPEGELVGELPDVFVAVESEAGSGTGYSKVRWELFSWDGQQLHLALDTIKSCRIQSPSQPKTEYSGTLLAPRYSMENVALRFNYSSDFKQSSGAPVYDLSAAGRAACGAKGSSSFCEESLGITGSWVDVYKWNPDKKLFVPEEPKAEDPVRMIKGLVKRACDDEQFGVGEAEPAPKQ
jgi:hypothetical protein